MAPFCPTLLLSMYSSTNEVLFVSAFAIASVRPDGPVGNIRARALTTPSLLLIVKHDQVHYLRSFYTVYKA